MPNSNQFQIFWLIYVWHRFETELVTWTTHWYACRTQSVVFDERVLELWFEFWNAKQFTKFDSQTKSFRIMCRNVIFNWYALYSDIWILIWFMHAIEFCRWKEFGAKIAANIEWNSCVVIGLWLAPFQARVSRFFWCSVVHAHAFTLCSKRYNFKRLFFW